MSKANSSRRKKLLTNIFHSGLSASDKMVFYAMNLKYIDGEQLLEYIETEQPTIEQLIQYIESKLKENRVRRNGKTEET